MDAWPSAVRDPRIDTLRGLFLVVMMVDHLPQHPLLHFTVQSFGVVSAAEGFVFVSGFVCAWVYGRILVKDGEAALRRRAWHRARDIYLTHLVLYTLVLLGGLWGGRQIASRFPDFWTGWWHGALLIFQPPFFGILPMYVVFLLLTPFLLEQMARGRALLIGSASMALWLAAQWGSEVRRTIRRGCSLDVSTSWHGNYCSSLESTLATGRLRDEVHRFELLDSCLSAASFWWRCCCSSATKFCLSATSS